MDGLLLGEMEAKKKEMNRSVGGESRSESYRVQRLAHLWGKDKFDIKGVMSKQD